MKIYIAAVVQPWGLDEEGLLVTTNRQAAERQHASWVEEAAQKEEGEIEPHLFEYEVPWPHRMELKVHAVIGMFDGRIDQVVITPYEDMARGEEKRMRTEYDMPLDEALDSEHDVRRVSATLTLPGTASHIERPAPEGPSLNEAQVAKLAFEAVELMGDVFYDATHWSEPYTCEPCDEEYQQAQASGFATDEDRRPLCPSCGEPLTSADERIRQMAEGAVQYAIEAALRAVGGKVNHPNQGTVSDAFLDRLVDWVMAHETPEQM